MVTQLSEFQILSQTYQNLRLQHLTPVLTEQNISKFSSEEIYATVNNLYPEDNSQIADWCLSRLFELIQEDIANESSKIDEEGRITVDMRIFEPHLFAKTLGAIALNQDFFMKSEQIWDLSQYAMVYLKRHTNNLSFDDKSLALVSLMNFSNPTPGNF